MFRVALGGVFLAVLMTSAATAADLIVEEDVVEAAVAAGYDWNGAYGGAFVGGGWGTAAWDGVNWVAGWDDIDLSGGLVGIAAGANFQTDAFVLGIEGDIAMSNIGGLIECPNPNFDCSTDVNWLATLRGRAGFAADTALFYVTAGLAVADVEALTVDTVVPLDEDGTLTETYVGWAAGVGAEVAVTENISLKAEYLYVDLGTREDSGSALPLDGVVGLFTEVGVSAHTVKAGLNFHF